MTRPYAPILLALGLLLALNVPAATAIETPVGEVPILAFDEEEEPEAEAAAEDDVEVEECEEFEEGLEEECGEVEAEPRRQGRGSPEDCLLRSARGHASVDPRGKKLKLTIGYTTYEPVKAKIKVSKVATLQRYLGHSGVLRITKNLGAKKAPKRVVVRIEIPSAKKAGCPSRRLVLSPR